MSVDEKALRKGIIMGLGSQGIWTPELENIMFHEITEALNIHNDVERSKHLIYLLKKLLENNMCSHEGDDLIKETLKIYNELD